MDNTLDTKNSIKVLKKYNLSPKKYIHLGSYGKAKGQKIASKHLKSLGLTMIATSGLKIDLESGIKNVKLINANYNEYNILLKNAMAVVCMSEFKEGWCRVLHEAAIHGTPILGSGLGGMKELLKIGNFSLSKPNTLLVDLKRKIKSDYSLINSKRLYRSFTLDRFSKAWIKCIDEVIINYNL